jgi:integrase
MMSRFEPALRYIRPKLKDIGLAWINFHMLRRTHSSLMRNLDQVVIFRKQRGHIFRGPSGGCDDKEA